MTSKTYSKILASAEQLPREERLSLIATLARGDDIRSGSGDDLSKIADDIKRAEYYGAVRSMAKEGADKARAGEFSDREELIEWVHESVDGSYWVIYTHANLDVLRYSDNDSAYSDNFGAEGMTDKSGNINWAALAYAAMEQDVMEALSAEGIDPNGEPEEWKGESETEEA
jgi:hypothetical protein